MRFSIPAILFTCLFLLMSLKSHSTEALSISQEKQATNQDYAVSLSDLSPKTTYQINFVIRNLDSGATQITVIPELLSSSNYHDVTLNGAPMKGNTGSLQPGENTLSVQWTETEGDPSRFNRIRLHVENNASVRVDSAHANAMQKPVALSQKSVSQSKLYSRSFIVSNRTNRKVTVAVGNYLPVSYAVYPHDWRYVYVSSDNQNITIESVD